MPSSLAADQAAPSPPVSASGDATVCPTDQESLTPRKNARSFDYVWKSGVAGGMAGCAGKTVVAPLDRVKILFQASNPQFAKYTGSSGGVVTAMGDIYRSEGGIGLFRGHSATLLRIFPYAGIKFLAYEQIRAWLIPGPSYETPLRRLLGGSLAGVTSVFFTYPLEVVRVRLAFETKGESRSSMTSICRQIYHEHPMAAKSQGIAPSSSSSSSSSIAPRAGLSNFYRGFLPTLLGMLPYAGMSFLTHDTVSDLLRHPSIAAHTTLERSPSQQKQQGHHLQQQGAVDKPAPLRSWAELTAGAAAGLVSQTASYPLEVIRRRMQVGGAVGDGRRLRLAETSIAIMRERGLRGFFVGLTIGYVKVIPMAAVSFYTYERMKLVLGI